MEWSIPNSPATKFRLQSITKQLTAAAILLLEERGKLKTDDPVKKLMPDAPAAWDKITIFHLLTHTSGIPNFTTFSDFGARDPSVTTPEEAVARFRDRPLDFQPGEEWRYNNSGYVLLGYLLEKATGESYEKFVQENIFTPMGMKDSGYNSSTAIIPRRAADYIPGKAGPEYAGFIHMSKLHGYSAAALYSTTEDLLRWQRGLYGGKLLSAASLAKMISPTETYSKYAMGVGVWPIDHNGHTYHLIFHAGGVAPGRPGQAARLLYLPEKKLTVVVLANLDTGPANKTAVLQIAERLLQLALGGSDH